MKPLIWLPLSCAAVLLLSNCANNKSASANDPLGTGPFDSNGNYREDWADDPTKWRKPSSRQAQADDLPVVAANDVPSSNVTPLAPADSGSSKPKSTKSSSSRSTASSQSSTRTSKSKSTASRETSTRPKSVASTKTKSKPKPSTVTYTVKSGDSLYTIASRYGSSVEKIRSANGISGSMIHPGQKLKVPQR